jgi:DNA replication protein DnaC
VRGQPDGRLLEAVASAFKLQQVPEQVADDLLDIILTRYSARRSTVISSNRPLEDWGKLLRDNAASSAIVDRLLHRGQSF